VVIRLSDGEKAGKPGDDEFQPFEAYKGGDPASLGADDVRGLLVESGLWSSFRTRPFSRIPAGDATPDAIFVTATDTAPLAARPSVVIRERRQDFDLGLKLVATLTEGTTFLCISGHGDADEGVTAPVQVEKFEGPHPAGTAGVHIHLLSPVSRQRTVWTIGYQDVIAVGELFRTGKLPVERVISFAGPCVKEPKLLRTRLGASIPDIGGDRYEGIEPRVISGSVLTGKKAGEPVFAFLGRYDLQVSVVEEGRKREFLAWAGPGFQYFSVFPVFASKVFDVMTRTVEHFRPKTYEFDTNTNGSLRAMVPIGLYEKVMPIDVVPSYLLRSLVVGDLEQAEKLGALELDEEDVALCTFVDPGKVEYGPILRRNLDTIFKEG
jgi:Na+-transporting NADH:ubiquinone oxidoreductase subunit A